jgi:ribonuclease HI
MAESNIKKITDIFKINNNNQVEIIDIPEFRKKKWYQVIKKRLKNNTNLKKEEIKKVLKKDINIGENIFCPKNIKLPIKIKERIEKKELIIIYTDGSLGKRGNKTLAGFGGTILLPNSQCHDFMGVVTEYSPSSTFAELLGIMMAIILIPENKKIIINTDSRASISIMTNLLKNKNTKSTNNSSLKYLLEWFRYWLKKNNKEIELKWVRGHKDNKENNYVD